MAKSPLAAMMAQAIAPPSGTPAGAVPPPRNALPAPPPGVPAAAPPVKLRLPAKRAPRPPAPGSKPLFGGKRAPPFMSQRKPPLGT